MIPELTPTYPKPTCSINNRSTNRFTLLGIASQALNSTGKYKTAQQMGAEVMSAVTDIEAREIMDKYVAFVE